MDKKQILRYAAIFNAGIIVGGFMGYLGFKSALKKKIDQLMTEEPETAEEIVEDILEEKLSDDTGYIPPPVELVENVLQETVDRLNEQIKNNEPPEPVVINIFEASSDDDDYDWIEKIDAEEYTRLSYTTRSVDVTYYVQEDIFIDQDDDVIEDPETVLGIQVTEACRTEEVDFNDPDATAPMFVHNSQADVVFRIVKSDLDVDLPSEDYLKKEKTVLRRMRERDE